MCFVSVNKRISVQYTNLKGAMKIDIINNNPESKKHSQCLLPNTQMVWAYSA